MGACASTPKTLDDNVEKVPAPELPKEENSTVATNDVVVEEVKTDVVATGEQQEKSLGSLLENTEEVKKETVEEPKEAVATAPAVEEKKEEVIEATTPAVEAPVEEAKKE